MNTYVDWTQVKADIFWGEVAPCDHILQIYETDAVFIDTLAGFVGNGINAGDCCIVIATRAHLQALNRRLTSYGIRIDTLVQDKRYIPLDAEETLAKFMVNGWPDEKLFMKLISELVGDCRKSNRRIRAFGEMVAILWAQGYNGATVQLEHLWNKFCENETLCLFCAYPKAGFTGDINHSANHICDQHSKVISGSESQLTEIYYRDSQVA
jgi:hypothetical protein